jgi:hypothetical protein
MYQTLLLRALDAIVYRIKVRNQNSLKVSQEPLQELSLSGRLIHEDDFFQVGEHPHIRLRTSLQLYVRLVNVQQFSTKNTLQDSPVCLSIEVGHDSLKHVHVRITKPKAEQLLEHLLNGLET